jgi:hypothetical protein
MLFSQSVRGDDFVLFFVCNRLDFIRLFERREMKEIVTIIFRTKL